MRTSLPIRLLSLLAFSLLLFAPLHALGATYTVTDTTDSAADTGSIRYAVAQANANPGSTINFDSTVFATQQTITLTNGELAITQPMTISGPAVNVVISGNNAGRVFEISGGTSASPITLTNLTIEGANVSGANGGGVLVDSGNATLTNCTFSGNSTNGSGGGLCNAGDSVTLADCTLSGNTAGTYGGGIYNDGFNNPSAQMALTNCTLTGNSASSESGGGLVNDDGTASLSNCTLSGNNANSGNGGGLENLFGAMTLTNCAVNGNNAASGFGGGLYNTGTTTLTNCSVNGNNGGTYGGGLYSSSAITLNNCSINGNAAGVGGGLYNTGGASTLTNCAISGNTGRITGGGLDNDNIGTATLTNCTVAGNITSAGGAGGAYNNGTMSLVNDIFYGDSNGEISNGGAVFSHCDIQGSGSSGANGNIDQNPLLINSSKGDLHLMSGSPCAGSGTTVAPNYLSYDLDGRPRPSSPSMGAYEAAPQGSYSLVVENDNDSAPTSLRSAIQCADDYPDAAITFDPTAFAALQTITLMNGNMLITNPTTIVGPTAGVAISGLGKADEYSGPDTNGIFEISGGTTANPVSFTNLFIENGDNLSNGYYTVTGGSGGGVLVDAGAALSMTSCSLVGNSVYTLSGGGGGLCNNGTVTLFDCAFTGNFQFISSNGGGGGILNNGTATLDNCTITGNVASYDSGTGGFCNNGTATLTNCTLTHNSVQYANSGGLSNSGTMTLTNDILFANSPGDYSTNANITVENCDIGQSGYAGTNGNISVNPDFLEPYSYNPNINQDYVFQFTPFNLELKNNSPCIGAGATSNEVPNGVTIPAADITGAVRPTPPSMGAYDVPAGSIPTTIALISTPAFSGPSENVTFTATVMDSYSVAPATAGSIIFDFGNGVRDTIPVGANGQVSITTRSLSPGIDTLSATYSDTGGPFRGSSDKLSHSIVTLATNTPSTATAGTTVKIGVKASDSSFSGTIALSSSDKSAVFGSPTITLANGSGTTTVTFGTAGSQTITATDTADSTITGTSSAVSVNPAPATVTGVTTSWGSRISSLSAGSVMLPAGRTTDVPWQGIKSFTITLSGPEALSANDVSVHGIHVADYGPVMVTPFGLPDANGLRSGYTITLAQPINVADIVTLSLGNAGIASFTGSLPVLPGDISDDGGVNASDMALMRNMIVKLTPSTIYGDINGDGIVNMTDYNLIKQHIATRLP